MASLRDSSLKQAAAAPALPPFAAHDPACRSGLRALPHLLQLTTLSFEEADCCGTECGVLGAALPYLLQLAHLAITEACTTADHGALAAGWVCAPALRALTCVTCSEVNIWPEPPAAALRLLTSLDFTIEEHYEDEELDIDMGYVASIPRLGGQISQLSALRALSISSNFDGAVYFAARPMLEALPAVPELRRLELSGAAVEGVDWGIAPLCALTVLCLRGCHAPDLLPALAQLRELRELVLQKIATAPDQYQLATVDVVNFVRRRVQLLATTDRPRPALDVDIDSYDDTVSFAALKEMLSSVEETGLRTIRVPRMSCDGAML